MGTQTGRARPRVGLLGNPSDMHGGRVLAFTFDDFEARVDIDDAEHEESPDRLFDVAADLAARKGLERLFAAAIRRFRRILADDPATLERLDRDRCGVRIESSIPRMVGLAGSSAVIIAALRALAARFDRELPSATLAAQALAAETEELAIAAGPQDRVVQSLEGLIDMEFSRPFDPSLWRCLEPRRLPPLLIAWDSRGAVDSGDAHRAVAGRAAAGDEEVRSVMGRLAEIAGEGAAILQRDPVDTRAFMALVDENARSRRHLYGESDCDAAMLAVAREAGCAAKLCGSGGAIVAVAPDPATRERAARNLLRIGVESIVPRISTVAGRSRA